MYELEVMNDRLNKDLKEVISQIDYLNFVNEFIGKLNDDELRISEQEIIKKEYDFYLKRKEILEKQIKLTENFIKESKQL